MENRAGSLSGPTRIVHTVIVSFAVLLMLVLGVVIDVVLMAAVLDTGWQP